MDDDIVRLSSEWLALKEQERQATDARREVEDQLIGLVNSKPDGSATTAVGNLTVKVTGRMNRRVDGDLLQDLAAEHGLTDHLATLFRWKPDINLAAWRAADPSITEPLLDAITTSEGRPSFNITNER
tara:strand:- start:5687 stop:6070 length:384 start_codon:yes stop_codon:yes gene_type:complete